MAMMNIDEGKFEEMCRRCQQLDTICDYIKWRIENDYDYVSTGILACMAGISISKEAKAIHDEDDDAEIKE